MLPSATSDQTCLLLMEHAPSSASSVYPSPTKTPLMEIRRSTDFPGNTVSVPCFFSRLCEHPDSPQRGCNAGLLLVKHASVDAEHSAAPRQLLLLESRFSRLEVLVLGGGAAGENLSDLGSASAWSAQGWELHFSRRPSISLHQLEPGIELVIELVIEW